MLSPRASDATLQAAGNVASWFGALSAYRGVRIQARDRLPTGHAIVLATPEDAPPGVASRLPIPWTSRLHPKTLRPTRRPQPHRA